VTKAAGHPVATVGRAMPAASPGRAEEPRLGDSHVVRHRGRVYRLFFLCGHPKSGTNWVGALLNLHPRVLCRGEYRFEALRQAFDRLERNWWHVAHDEPVRAEAERCFRETICRMMLASLHFNPGAEWIGDRTPRQAAPYIPGAPLVYVLRDPRDVIVSWTHQEVRENGPNAAREPHAAGLGPLHTALAADPAFFDKHPERLLESEPWVRFAARRYARHVSQDLDLIARARAGEADMPVHEVLYERLHADFERERATLFRFLGLDPAGARPADHATRTLPGFEREDPTGFFRRGQPGDWRRYFTGAARRWFNDEAGPILLRLGYEKDLNW
jgi:hypothetical protein